MRETLIESTELLYRNALSTMLKKNADYAGSSESMRNFKLSAEIANVTMSQGILTRLVDKVTRIGNLLQKENEVKDESVFDTIQDLINYSAILLYALKLEKNEKEKEKQLSMNFEPAIGTQRYGIGDDPIVNQTYSAKVQNVEIEYVK